MAVIRMTGHCLPRALFRTNARRTPALLNCRMRPQDPHGDGTGLRFEIGEHGGDYPDNMPQAITVTNAQGPWPVYVPLRVGGKIVVPEQAGLVPRHSDYVMLNPRSQ